MIRISQTTTSIAFFSLLGLTATSFALSYVHLGALNIPVALAIAALKATIVIGVFMELAVESVSVRATVLVAFVFVGLLVALMAGDVATRAPPPLLPPVPADS